jgi:endoribonuclease Dicer
MRVCIDIKSTTLFSLLADLPLAHHCKKNHPFSTIIRDYYLRLRDGRPRLFSMTASPVDSREDIMKTITELEELLHSRIVTTNDGSVTAFAHKPEDQEWIFDQPGLQVQTDLYKRLIGAKNLVPELESVFKDSLQASQTLGTWFGDRILAYKLGSTKAEGRNLLSRFETGLQFASMQSIEDRSEAMNQLKAFEDIAQLHHSVKLQNQQPFLSPKVQVLMQRLGGQYACHPDTKTMVFVLQRDTAVLLCDAVKNLDLPNVRPAFLTGAGPSGDQVVTGKKQQETMRHFHAGLVNLLFATSVGEEGLDVPQCNLIVRFDLYTTPIQYMQSRGRARMKGSIYAHMIENKNFEDKEMVRWAIASANYLKVYCQSLSPDRLLGRGTKLQQLIAQDEKFQTESGAICNFSNCLVILSRYASSLRHTGAMTSEVYEERILQDSGNQFQYVVRLPTNDKSKVARAVGKPRQNKALAKRAAAYKCVSLLRGYKLLDENLNSIFHAVKPENANARLAVGAKKDAYDMIVKPKLWQHQLGQTPERLYGTLIGIYPSKALSHQMNPLLLLTRLPLPDLPSVPMYLEDGIEAKVVMTTLKNPFTVGDPEMMLLTAFTLNAVFHDVFNKVYEPDPSQMGYWLAPGNNRLSAYESLSDIVDLEALNIAAKSRLKWKVGMSASAWCNKFLVDPMDGKYHYFTEDVVDGINAFDPEPAEYIPRTGKKAREQPVIFFTDSHWNIKQKEFLSQGWDRNQPVFSAELQTVRRNFLDRPTEQELAKHPCWIAPEPLEIGRVSPAMARTLLTWPSILHRLEAYLIALEAFQKMKIDGVSASLALEAFTKDDNVDDRIQQIHSGKCRGMGKNYERLEFIGDSLLKMSSTITVFNQTTCDEEGMHCRRMEILCNRRLFTVATTSLGLERYIRSEGFNRETWYPENLILLAGRGAKKGKEPVSHGLKSHSLGMKTIADVCEASIGAAVMASKMLPAPERFNLGIQAITRLVESEDHKVTEWDDFKRMYTPQGWQLVTDDPIAVNLAGEVSKRVGYKFQNPRLLRSAFTHSSDTTAPVPDLQRLEFLGDAVLDWVCIWWLFDSNPDKNPQWLTEHKMAMVSNKFLAALAVKLDFDKLFHCRTTRLADAISSYAEQIRAELEQPEYDKDFWTRVQVDKPPKALSDLVESTLGAMLIDSGFDYRPIEQFFETHVKPFFEDITLYDGYASMQPTSFLQKKLTEEYGCSNFKLQWDECQDGDEALEVETLAGILVHGNVVSSAKGKSSKYAKIRASQKAIAALEGMTRAEFRRRYRCNCKQGADMEEAGGPDLASVVALTTS